MPSASFAAGCVCAALAGMMLATQSGINATLGKHVGKSFASVVSFAVGLLVLVVFYAVDSPGLGNKGPTAAGVKAAPWWAWIGGALGAWYVAVVIIFAPVLGAATLMAIFVTAQLATAVLLDSAGWVGFNRRPLHWARLLGLGLMLAGVVLITYFDGVNNVSKAASGSGGEGEAGAGGGHGDAAAGGGSSTPGVAKPLAGPMAPSGAVADAA